MDKSDDPDQPLRTLNKLSHKISKPTSNNNRRQQQPQPQPDHPHAPDTTTTTTTTDAPQQQQQQPPVYNINKNDFREVVQKLTGSPSHPPPPHHPPPPPSSSSSRLHRIRPPPLSQLTHHHLPSLTPNPVPISPLPPFPSVHPAAESPISAYLRFFQSAPPLMPHSPFSGFPLSPLPSPGESTN